MESDRPLRLGTRGSPLALAQAREIAARFAAAHPALAAVETVVISTSGDAILDRTLADVGGKGLFTKEIDEALLDGRIDLAVHSSKDLPTALPEGIVVAAVPERADPRDAFISLKAARLRDLPAGALVGTASLRRAAQVLGRRPDIKVTPLRGNVQTRLRRLEEGVVDATLLGAAGLVRLGLLARATALLEPDEMLPAVGQGAIAVACRANDGPMRERLAAIDHVPSHLALRAERAYLAVLDGSCRTPIAGFAVLRDADFDMRGLVASPDGARVAAAGASGPSGDPEGLGRSLAHELRERSALWRGRDGL